MIIQERYSGLFDKVRVMSCSEVKTLALKISPVCKLMHISFLGCLKCPSMTNGNNPSSFWFAVFCLVIMAGYKLPCAKT